MVGIPPMKIVILGMDGLWHLVYHMNLPLNPTLSPSFEIGQEWQYLPRWGAPNTGKKHETVGGKVIYTTILAYILLLDIYNMCTYWCDSLSLSAFPAGFSKPWLFHRPGERPSSMVAAMRPWRGGEKMDFGPTKSNGDWKILDVQADELCLLCVFGISEGDLRNIRGS